MIKSEQSDFFSRVGAANAEAASSIHVTCPGCYDDLSKMIEIYRQGEQAAQKSPVSFEQAFSAWYDEAYLPNIEAIRRNDLLAEFPDRTEADLFVWAWHNGTVLEELDLEDESMAGQE